MQKLQSILIPVLASLTLATGTAAAQTGSDETTDETKQLLGVDTRLLVLLDNDVTRPVLEKHLPNLAKRFQEDLELADYFWDSTLRDLSVDDIHVRGFDEELLEKLAADLLAAQS